MNTHLVFVYGTLRRRRSKAAMSKQFPSAKFIAKGTVTGSLYDLGAYPGLLTHWDGPFVKGEVYAVDDETLSALDEFEASSNFRRKEVGVYLPPDSLFCWVYEPNPELCANRELITSGDWLEYANTKRQSKRHAG